jgi:hypothetical protein
MILSIAERVRPPGIFVLVLLLGWLAYCPLTWPHEGRYLQILKDPASGLDRGEAPGLSEATENPAPEWLDLGGDLSLWSVANLAHGAPEAGQVDHRGVNRLKAQIRLEAKFNLPGDWRAKASGHAFYDTVFSLRGREEFTPQILDKYEQEAEIEEAWLQGGIFRNLDFKIGRQIVVWGKSDNLRVTDVLNPLNLLEPGLADIKDLRLPRTMSRVDWYFNDWSFTGIVVHEVRFTKYPPFGSDFFTSLIPLPPEEQPGLGLDNQDYALAVNRTFKGCDVSLYGAHLFSDRPYLEWAFPRSSLRHPRLTMAGAAANWAFGNWLFKGEAAHFWGLKFSSLTEESFSRLDVLLGVEYYGWNETTICLEAADYHVLRFDPRLEKGIESTREDDFEWAFRLTRDFMHDRLQFTFFATIFEPKGENGGFERLQIDYEWSGSITLTLGVALYQSGERFPTKGIGNNDRLFGQVKYSF